MTGISNWLDRSASGLGLLHKTCLSQLERSVSPAITPSRFNVQNVQRQQALACAVTAAGTLNPNKGILGAERLELGRRH